MSRNYQIKIFAGMGTIELENSVNQWLRKNSETIKLIGVSNTNHVSMPYAVIVSYEIVGLKTI